VAGLGNPGREYAFTRHNIGFIVVDELARRFSLDGWRKKSGAEQGLLRTHDVLLVKPQTFMNSSGAPLRVIASWHKVQPASLLVVVDDLDLPFGKLRMRRGGSSGGHNGLKSIIALFGEDFPRLRIGIGRGREGEAIDRVLGTFSENERAALPKVVGAAADGVERWLAQDVEVAINFVNAWSLAPQERIEGKNAED
jgi:PTH1 family peptidyl-tRNA hydrolase